MHNIHAILSTSSLPFFSPLFFLSNDKLARPKLLPFFFFWSYFSPVKRWHSINPRAKKIGDCEIIVGSKASGFRGGGGGGRMCSRNPGWVSTSWKCAFLSCATERERERKREGEKERSAKRRDVNESLIWIFPRFNPLALLFSKAATFHNLNFRDGFFHAITRIMKLW